MNFKTFSLVLVLRAVLLFFRLLSAMAPLDVRTPGTGPDIEGWVNSGIPGASLWNKNDKYFWFHHSDGDTMTVEKPENLDMATALFAATSYVLADINLDLPRHPPGMYKKSISRVI